MKKWISFNVALLVLILLAMLMVDNALSSQVSLIVSSDGEAAKIKNEVFAFVVTSEHNHVRITNYPIYLVIATLLFNVYLVARAKTWESKK